MKVFAINGSSRKNGNTSILIEKVFEPLRLEGIKCEQFQMAGHEVRGCRACYKCSSRKNRRCSYDGDIVNDCIAKMIEADAIILGSPVYVTDVSSEMKALIDRTCLVAKNNGNFLKFKVGAAVMAERRGGAIHAFDTMNHFFTISEMFVVGSNYWNFAFGLVKGDVYMDKEGLETMRVLGENMAWLLKKIHQ